MSDFAATIALLDASRPVIVSDDASKLICAEACRREVVLVLRKDAFNGVVADRSGYSVWADGRRQHHAHSGTNGMHVAPLTNLQRALLCK